jgi:hypothetical protein
VTVSVADSAVMLVGLGVIVRPAGAPDTLRFTAPENPPDRVMVTAAGADEPCGTLIDVGETAMTKLGAANVATTALLAVTDGVNTHVGVVATQAPDHPVNVLPAAGDAVRVSGSAEKVAVQTLPQLMPAGLDTTVPEPEPARVTPTDGPYTVTEIDGGSPTSPAARDAPVTVRKTSRIVGDASGAAASVSVLEAVRPVTAAGLNVAVTPVGKFSTPSVTALFLYSGRVTLIVTVFVWPTPSSSVVADSDAVTGSACAGSVLPSSPSPPPHAIDRVAIETSSA